MRRRVSTRGRVRPSPVYSERRMRLAHITDVHLSVDRGDPRGELEFTARHGDGTDVPGALDAALAHAAGRGAGAVLVTGDLTEHGTLAELRRFNARARRRRSRCGPSPATTTTTATSTSRPPTTGRREEASSAPPPSTATSSAIGPRWWSRDHGSLHIVGLDWFSALCGIDGDAQRDFLAADLSPLPDGTQVLLLSHDQLDEEWFEHIREVAPGVRVVGALSGHCHSPKVFDEEGCLHVSTGSACFGGLDWTPPQVRLLDWDGSRLTVSTPQRPGRRRGGRRTAGVGRLRSLVIGGGQHLAGGAVCDGVLAVPAVDPDSPGAVVVGIDAESGPRWWCPLPGAPVTGLAAEGDALVCVTQSGGVHCLGAGDGAPRWQRQLGDPCRNRLMSAPVPTGEGAVIAGNLAALAALDLDGGGLRWVRDDLGPVDTLLTLGAGICADGAVVLPFSGPHRGLTSIAVGDGGVRWTDPPRTPAPLSSVVDAGGGDGLVVRDGPLLERFELASGTVRWRQPLRGRFSTAPPHHGGGTVTVVTGDAVLHRLDALTGECELVRPLSGVREGYGPYRTTGAGAPSAPVEVDGALVLVLIDGSVWVLPADREAPPELVADLGTEVTAQPVAFAGRLAVVDSAGVVHLVEVATTGVATAPD